MKVSAVVSVLIYFMAFAMPVISAYNCRTDGGIGGKATCVVEGKIFHKYNRMVTDLFVISLFTGGVPILLYIFVVVYIERKIARLLR